MRGPPKYNTPKEASPSQLDQVRVEHLRWASRHPIITLSVVSAVTNKFSVVEFKMIRSFVGKIQKGVSQIGPGKPALNYVNENQLKTINVVPGDVSKGYFAVIAIKDGEIKRFVVELDYLTNPAFLGLLDQAGEEYGFNQQGTLAVPCRPQELQKILDGWRIRPDRVKSSGRDIYVPKFP
ncbi:unnamed protein product [Sphenostylis stenocarpa]|uniref:Uncharacterized protein n=1 Tax=Sphenostylis stenocarpa TaxID=92480 RepID=A0AA86RSV6_9FABA|nr:unnamed protein product [Sphenostylis stenocarpa]